MRSCLLRARARNFEAGNYAKAKVDFDLCIDKLERDSPAVGAVSWLLGKRPFDRKKTGHRNLDDYMEKCEVLLKRERKCALLDELEEKERDQKRLKRERESAQLERRRKRERECAGQGAPAMSN